MITYNIIFCLFSSSQKCQEVHWKFGHKTNCKFQPSGVNSTSSLAGRKSSAIALVPAHGTSKFIKPPQKVVVGLFFSLFSLLYTISDLWIIGYFSTMEKLITRTCTFSDSFSIWWVSEIFQLGEAWISSLWTSKLWKQVCLYHI